MLYAGSGRSNAASWPQNPIKLGCQLAAYFFACNLAGRGRLTTHTAQEPFIAKRWLDILS